MLSEMRGEVLQAKSRHFEMRAINRHTRLPGILARRGLKCNRPITKPCRITGAGVLFLTLIEMQHLDLPE